MTVGIIGLGLIGGSMALKLSQKGYTVIGCARSDATLQSALARGAVREAYADPRSVFENSDLVVVALYPDLIVPMIRDNAAYFKDGAVLTEVCGVKFGLTGRILDVLPPHVDYVGCHPMAGKEVEGFVNAESSLFENTGFIITPHANSKPESVELLRRIASDIGATKLAVTDPHTHDGIIAYTSDLMHVAASALCLDFHRDMTLAFAAGAFRDCTRIANINPEMWSELLLSNKDHTLTEIDRLMTNLDKFRSALKDGDKDRLFDLFAAVKANKEEMQSR